ncbi:hypothetical protein PF007_g29945 [Phytophthora fragariae]|uniref:Uncharacterized protein n=1 Tax=Phytophthora fragariae TaxID=53985 RepID=A0A6A3PKJ2_9STRA|nr:hypothetical protein PF007_g29945 [Phytophthora fragariae]
MRELTRGVRADSTGTVATSRGFVPVEFAADYDVESSVEDTEEQDSQPVPRELRAGRRRADRRRPGHDLINSNYGYSNPTWGYECFYSIKCEVWHASKLHTAWSRPPSR